MRIRIPDGQLEAIYILAEQIQVISRSLDRIANALEQKKVEAAPPESSPAFHEWHHKSNTACPKCGSFGSVIGRIDVDGKSVQHCVACHWEERDMR